MIFLIDRLINRIIMLLVLILLFLSLYSLYDSYQIYEDTKIVENIKLFNPTKIDKNEYNNKNIIGWLKIYNTIIDYPILQGNDNIEYLTKNYKNEYSSAGSIFLDYRNNKYFKDDFSIIYGHNMSYTSMFSELKYYKDNKYFNSHRSGKLYLKDITYNLNVILYKEINEDDDIPYNLYLYKNNSNNLIYKKLMNKNGNKNKLLLLSTCKSGQRNKRVILLLELNKI